MFKTMTVTANAILLLTLSSAASLAGCSSADDSPSGSNNPKRTPIGKADATGKCLDNAKSYCGGKSDGNCWCDEGCAVYGDCCPDVSSACGGSCSAQDAKGIGACEMFMGYIWNGTECAILSGCSCSGSDCHNTYSSREACQSAHTDCG